VKKGGRSAQGSYRKKRNQSKRGRSGKTTGSVPHEEGAPSSRRKGSHVGKGPLKCRTLANRTLWQEGDPQGKELRDQIQTGEKKRWPIAEDQPERKISRREELEKWKGSSEKKKLVYFIKVQKRRKGNSIFYYPAREKGRISVGRERGVHTDRGEVAYAGKSSRASTETP